MLIIKAGSIVGASRLSYFNHTTRFYKVIYLLVVNNRKVYIVVHLYNIY